MFSEVNCNSELIGDLGKVVKWRNFCAHNAFVHDYLDRASESPFSAHETEDVIAVVKLSSALVERLCSEMKVLRDLHQVVLRNDRD
jgi:hypothetical protein